MLTADLDILWRREKSMTLKLQEVEELTRQIAQAADRDDETSVTILLSMREEPVRQLYAADQALRESLEKLPQTDAVRARELLEGSEARIDEELPLVQQVGQYRRLLKTVRELDQRISLRVGGNRSFYKSFRQ